MRPIDDIVAELRAAGCVFAEDEAALIMAAAATRAELDDLVRRRVEGLPLEHVVGWAEFCGLRIAVDVGVFVPRRRTEFLARQGIDLVRQVACDRPVVLDLCCGSGAVGAVLSAAREQVELYAVDVDPAAVRCARRNLVTVEGQVYEGDLYEPLPRSMRGRVDVLVANAPYVPTGAIALLPPEARLHEATIALDGGPDGLETARRVVAEAPRWLAPHGVVLIETSEGQAPELVSEFSRHAMVAHIARDDDVEATVVIGQRKLT